MAKEMLSRARGYQGINASATREFTRTTGEDLREHLESTEDKAESNGSSIGPLGVLTR